jgi:hypothetical protein
MGDGQLLSLLTNGGVPAMFAALLIWTLKTSADREERNIKLSADREERLMKREEMVLSKLDEMSKTILRISTQLDSLAREIDRMRGED